MNCFRIKMLSKYSQVQQKWKHEITQIIPLAPHIWIYLFIINSNLNGIKYECVSERSKFIHFIMAHKMLLTL